MTVSCDLHDLGDVHLHEIVYDVVTKLEPFRRYPAAPTSGGLPRVPPSRPLLLCCLLNCACLLSYDSDFVLHGPRLGVSVERAVGVTLIDVLLGSTALLNALAILCSVSRSRSPMLYLLINSCNFRSMGSMVVQSSVSSWPSGLHVSCFQNS